MKTAVIGLGLIGGSMAKAFKDNTDSEVYGLDINASVMLKAKLVGAIDGELTDDILAQCDRVIIALYPESTVEFLQSKADIIKKGAAVIDCSGVKRYVFTPAHELAKAHGFEFIGGHPMAGVERWGFDSSFGMLFNNASMILTPDGGTVGFPEIKGVTDRTNPYNPSAYGALYESMFKTIIPFNVSAMLWYQGESDRNYPNPNIKARYKTGFRMLENTWRRDLLNPEMPIFTVQIAPFDYARWEGKHEVCLSAEIRCAQDELSHDDNVYMISIGDSGEMCDIHPRNKSVVGKRLANCALSVLYSADIAWKSPRFNRAVRKDGVIRVYFDDTYGGLLTNQSPILNMELKHGDEWKPVMFWIENDFVYTDIEKESEEKRDEFKEMIENATAIRYCYEDWYVTNIFSRAGLPAIPFCDKEIVDAF